MHPVIVVSRFPAHSLPLRSAQLPLMFVLVAIMAMGCRPQEQVTPAADTRPGPASEAVPAPQDDSGMPGDAFDDQPDEDVPPATAAALPPQSGASGPARLDGYGPLTLGMTADEMLAAWTGEPPLVAAGGDTDDGACHYLWPDEAGDGRPAFMLEGGHFVRYDISDPGLEAPGGGRVTMQADAIRALHAGRHETRPHKYVEGGQYLRVAGDADDGVLVFEVDADGVVTGWRVGRAPQVDYVEGCS